jgi:hypothetical protein
MKSKRCISLIIATVINSGVILTILFTGAIMVSDHDRSIGEWILAIFYLPHTILFALAVDFIFGKTHPEYFLKLSMLFVFGLPVSCLYTYCILKLWRVFKKMSLQPRARRYPV